MGLLSSPRVWAKVMALLRLHSPLLLHGGTPAIQNEIAGDLCTISSLIEILGFILFYFIFFVFLGPHPQRMEVPRLGVKSEPLLPAYTRATATPDLSCVCNLHHSSGQLDP